MLLRQRDRVPIAIKFDGKGQRTVTVAEVATLDDLRLAVAFELRTVENAARRYLREPLVPRDGELNSRGSLRLGLEPLGRRSTGDEQRRTCRAKEPSRAS